MLTEANETGASNELAAAYERDGYAVARGVVPRELIDSLLELYQREIIPSSDAFYRQNTNRYERNRVSGDGYVQQSFLDIHGYRDHADFSERALRIYFCPELQRCLQKTTGGREFRLMQSMLFDQNTQTGAHQDAWYLDSVPNGHLFAVWIALEDIHEDAGRFFLVPGSHRIDFRDKGQELPHTEWLERISKYVAENRAEVDAPALSRGDVIIWNSHTVHGSLATRDPRLSRRSLTAHFLPDGYAFGNYFTRKDYVRYTPWQGHQFYRNQPDDSPWNRAKARIKDMAYNHPTLLRALRVVQRVSGNRL